jgi:ribosomal protein L3 glutamine methyltransferase
MSAEYEGLETVVDFVRWGASRLRAAGVVSAHGNEDPVDEALALVCHALHLPQPLPPEFYGSRLTPGERGAVAGLIGRRIDERRPTAYLTGEAWFAGLRFRVDERVLIPRSPIAELIEAGFAPWADPARVERVLDLCTGSGCIAIACAAHLPDVLVDATDISEEALEVAADNVRFHGLEDRVRLLRSDLFDAIPDERYDVIVSNPPYVPRAEFEDLPPEFGHEPALGLVAGEDGLDVVRRLLAEAGRHLNPGGILVVEVGSAAPAALAAWPELPFAWPEFERGGEGVFVLTAAELAAAGSGGERGEG